MNDKVARGVYFMASDRVIELAITFLNSFRKHNPKIPLCLIPYNSLFSEVASMRAKYDFSIYNNQSTLDDCDAISRDYFITSCGQFRKLAAWEGPFNQFIYVDIDTVILHSFSSLFKYLSYAEFITSHSDHPDLIKWVWKSTITEQGAIYGRQVCYAANTGFILSSKRSLSIATALRKRPFGVSLKPHMELLCAEQPYLNLLIVTSGYRYSSLSQIKSQYHLKNIPKEIWAGFNPEITCIKGKYYHEGDSVLLIHWAGEWQIHNTLKQSTDSSPPDQNTHVNEVLRRDMKMKPIWSHFRSIA